jgi:GNAT superfamily N-acetyltransferase
MPNLSHNQEVLLTRQRHEADRAGLHYDVRMIVGDLAHSWATKKEMPEPGKAIILWEQPVHDRAYALSKKVVIPKGQYGAGVTTLDWIRKGQISNPEEDEHKFTLSTKNGDRFLFKKLPDSYGKKAWLFKNLTVAKELEKTSSIKYTDIPKSMFDMADEEHKANYSDWSNRDNGSKRVGIYHEGNLVGFYSPKKSGDYWRTGTIYVDPKFRGKGLGTKAINDFFSQKKKGLAYIEPSNLGSMGAFTKAGFKEVKRTTFWQDENQPTEYALMKKEASRSLASSGYQKITQKTLLDRVDQNLTKKASLIAGAVGTHLAQNIATRAAMSSKGIGKYLANSFSQGAHGVVDTSLKAKAKRFVTGAVVPDIAVAHKKAHEAGTAMKPFLDKATSRQKVGLRMLSEGRIGDLKKYNLHKDQLVTQAHGMISKHIKGIPSMDHILDNAKKVEKVFKDKTHPLVSNISANISRGKKPVGGQFKPGTLSAKSSIAGSLSSAMADPAGGALSTVKTLASSNTFNNTRYGNKLNKMMEKHFVSNPIHSGVKSGKPETTFGKIKHKISGLFVNPVSAHLNRTSSAISGSVKS